MKNSQNKDFMHNLSLEVFAVFAQLQTASLALQHAQDEADPIDNAVTISYVVEDAAKRLKTLHEKMIDEGLC